MLGIQWQEEEFELATSMRRSYFIYMIITSIYHRVKAISVPWVSRDQDAGHFVRSGVSFSSWISFNSTNCTKQSPLIQELRLQFRMHLWRFSLAIFPYVMCAWLHSKIMCEKCTKALAKYVLDRQRRHLQQSRCSGYNLWQQGFKKKS